MRGHAPRENFGFELSHVPFSWVSESLRQDIGQFHSPWMKHPIHFPDFNLESVFIKSIFIIKNLTDFRKTVVTSVDPRLQRLIK